MTFTVYEATNPATPPETLARMATDRPDLRQFVAANPATPPSVVEWLGTLGDYAVDAALARRRPAAVQHPPTYPPPSGPPGTAASPAADAARPPAGQPWAPTSSPGQPWAPTTPLPGQPAAGAATNPYATPGGTYGGPAGTGYGGPGPVSGSPLDAYGYQLPEPRGRRTGLIVAIGLAAVLIVGALVFAATSIFASLTDDSTYGEDPYLDRLWDACEAGDGQACDDLYLESPLGSGYEEFGDTCGNRFPAQEVWCVEVM